MKPSPWNGSDAWIGPIRIVEDELSENGGRAVRLTATAA
jgi:hypothetical protein